MRWRWAELAPAFEAMLDARADHLWFQVLEDWLAKLAPAEREGALAAIAPRVADADDHERRLTASKVARLFWPLARVLRVDRDARLGGDLAFLTGVELLEPTAAVVAALARASAPARWRTLTIEAARPVAAAARALARLPLDAVERLVLIGAGCGDEVIAALAGAALPALRELVLIQARVTSRGLAAVARAPWAGRLAALRTVSTPLTAAGARVLVGGFAATLEELDVPFAGLTPAALGALFARRWDALRLLDLCGNPLGLAGVRRVIGAGAALPRLTSLDVANTRSGDAAVVAIAGAPWLMARLDSLEVGGGPEGPSLGRAAMWALLRASSARGPRLNHGHVEWFYDPPLAKTARELVALCALPGLAHVANLHVRLTPTVADALAASRSLAPTSLSLDGEVAADALARVVANPGLRAVETLEIRGRCDPAALAGGVLAPRDLHLHVELDDDGAEALAATGFLARAEAIDVSCGRLTARGLARLLAAAPRLVTLAAGRNPLGIDGARAIAATRHAWRHLSLARTHLGDDGVRALLGSPGLAGLRSLDLSENRLTDDAIAAMEAAGVFARPRMILLGRNPLSAAAVERLAALARRPGFELYGRIDAWQRRRRGPPPPPPVPTWLDEVTLDTGEWAVAGTFALGTHGDVVARLRARGARAQRRILPTTTQVVIGAEPGPRQARAIARGLPLVREDVLHALLGEPPPSVVWVERARAAIAAGAWGDIVTTLDRVRDPDVPALAAGLAGAPALAPPRFHAVAPSWAWRWRCARVAPRGWLRRPDEPRLAACAGLEAHVGLPLERLRGLLPGASSIVHLDLQRVRTDRATARALASAPCAPSLRRLWLSLLGEPDVLAELAAGGFPSLELLSVELAAPDRATAPALARLPCWTRLASLTLHRAGGALPPAPRLRHLQVFGPASLDPGPWPALEELWTDAPGDAIARLDAPLLRRLVIGRPSRALLASAVVGAATHLALPGGTLDRGAVERLIASGFARPGAWLGAPPPHADATLLDRLRERGVLLDVPAPDPGR